MSAVGTSYQISEASFKIEREASRSRRDKEFLHYLVIEANGAQTAVSIIWNVYERSRPKYAKTTDKSTMMAQAILREKEYRKERLSPVELRSLRFRGTLKPMPTRYCYKEATPAASCPTINPQAIADTITALQAQISKLTADLALLRTELQQLTGANARLTQQLAATEAELARATAALRILLS